MTTVEERLERLEKEVALLKLTQSSKVGLASQKPGWIAKIVGSFKDAPDFAEILRLGREERQADIVQPAPIELDPRNGLPLTTR